MPKVTRSRLHTTGWLLLALLAMPSPAWAGRLDDAGDATRDSRSRPSRRERTHTRGISSSGRQVECDGCAAGLMRALGWLFISPWLAPYRVLEGKGEGGSQPYRYASHPYGGSEPGLWLAETAGEDAAWPSGGHRLELHLEGAYQVEHLARGRVFLRWRTPPRIEPTAEWLGWAEPQPGRNDLVLLGQYGLSLRFAQRQGLAVRTGLRALHWLDARGSRPGGVFTYGIEAFPRKPWSLAFDVGLGAVGSAFYGRVRTTLGYVFGTAELYAGYDHVVLRSPNHEARLTGPVVGVRLWF